MFKRRLERWQLIIVETVAVMIQIITMIIAASKEGGRPAIFGMIATSAITMWLDDTVWRRNTRKRSKACIILTMASIFLTLCGFAFEQSISLSLIIQLTLEFAFMVAIIIQTKYKPMP